MQDQSDIEFEIAAFHQPAIDRARKMIFWAGMMYAIIPLAIFAMLAQLAGGRVFTSWPFAVMFGGGLAVWGLHVALAQWAKKSPLPATSIALAVFLTYIGALFYYHELSSPIVPAIGLFILGRAVLASYRVHKLRAGARAITPECAG